MSKAQNHLPVYDFYLPEKYRKLTDSQQRLVFLVSGWSKYPAQQMSYRGTYSQIRFLVGAYLMTHRMAKEERGAHMYALSTVNFSGSFREYLYKALQPNATSEDFRRADEKVYTPIIVDRSNADEKTKICSIAEESDPILLDELKRKISTHKISALDTLIGLSVYKSDQHWQRLAENLDIPYLGCPQELTDWGTKSGSRRAFRDAGIPHAHGTYFIARSIDDLAEGVLSAVREQKIDKVMIKMDEGAQGIGNRVVDFSNEAARLRSCDKPPALALVKDRLLTLPQAFLDQINGIGAIVEEYFEGSDFRSASADFVITADGKARVLNSYELIMGGEQKLAYTGSIGPQNWDVDIEKLGLDLAESLSRKGVRDHFACDFVTFKDRDMVPRAYAVEINLRKSSDIVPLQAILYLAGDDGLKKGCFLTYDDVNIGGFRNLTWDVWREKGAKLEDNFFNWLSSQPFTYTEKTGYGCLVHGHCLPKAEVDVTIIAKDKSHAFELLNKMSSSLRGYADPEQGAAPIIGRPEKVSNVRKPDSGPPVA